MPQISLTLTLMVCSSANDEAKASMLRELAAANPAGILQRRCRAHVHLPGTLCRFGFPSFVEGIRGALRRARPPFNLTGAKTCHTSMVL